MAKRKRAIPQYGTVTLNGIDYYRTRVQNADGKLVALYARTPEELYDKELGALEQIDNDTFCRKSPTVADYCEKWLFDAVGSCEGNHADRLYLKGQTAHYKRTGTDADGRCDTG